MEKTYAHSEVIDEERFILSDVPFLPMMDIPHVREMIDHLINTGEGRIQVMDKYGIDMQVLSFVSPGVQVFDAATGIKMAKDINDKLSRIVNEHPTRFAGLASLALQNPNEAADELEGSVRDLGLKGACIFPHTKGEYPDDKKYWVVFEAST